jgi:hypothetical protein
MAGMSGWLPLRKHLEDIARDEPVPESDLEDGEDPFSSDKRATSNVDPVIQAIAVFPKGPDFPRPWDRGR